MRTLPTATVFTRADALSCGWSDSALTRAVRSGRVIRLRRNQFARVNAKDDPRLAAIAAARSCGGSVISHRSAAVLHDLPLLDPPPRPDLTVRPDCTGDVTAALLHRASLRDEDVVELDGVLVTSVPRTLVDLARSVSVPAAVVTIDAALHRGWTNAEELGEVRRMCRTWPGASRVPQIFTLADARAESPLESFSRLVIRRLGIIAPALQPSLHDGSGRFLGRPDLYWDEFGVAGEADGRDKYDDRDVLTAEKLRQERLENAGLVVVRWGWTDARNRPQLLRQRLVRAFERGRRRDDSGFPRLWSVRPA
jgi:hypothetical protein